MAAPKRVPELEELARRAWEELRKRDPHHGEPPPPYSDEEYEAMKQEADRFDREVMAPASESDKSGKLGSDLISEDRRDY